MEGIRDWLDGKKTYIGFAAVAIYSALIYAGATDSNDLVWGLITAWTGVSLRAAVSK